MARKQMVGLKSSATRARLLDAAEQLMREEGYAAVTSRKVGAKADIRPQLVHYYFPTMDDLFLALYHRLAEQLREATEAAMSTSNPWLSLWKLAKDSAETGLNFEFLALANHRKSVRKEMVKCAEELRQLQHDTLLRNYESRGIEPEYPPSVVTLILSSLGQQVAVESELGITFGHDETARVIEQTLTRYFSREDGEMPQ